MKKLSDPEGRLNLQVILLHGAGAGTDSGFLQRCCAELGKHGVDVLPYDFEYMRLARQLGKRRPPPAVAKLVEELRQLVEQQSGPVLLIGKSMGGRVASMLAADDCPANLAGVAVMGYPFIGQSKKQGPRIGHFKDVRVPFLVCQGTRDSFGKQEQVAAFELEKGCPEMVWLEGGDHDFATRKSDGSSQNELISQAVTVVVDWATQAKVLSK